MLARSAKLVGAWKPYRTSSRRGVQRRTAARAAVASPATIAASALRTSKNGSPPSLA